LLLSGAASAQGLREFHFSIDWHGPTVGLLDSSFGFPITEGDVLEPLGGMPVLGPLPVPSIQFSAEFAPVPGLGLVFHGPCVGHPGGTPCKVEVDALDYGRSHLVQPGTPLKGRLMFSVDRFAVGAALAVPPSVLTENGPPVFEASGDAFLALGLVAGPLPPFAAPLIGNVGMVDGNGLPSGSGFAYPGLGLREPNPPAGGPASAGDNLDAMAVSFFTGPLGFPPMGVFFSLDAAFVDPLTGVPNSGSAAMHGFVAGAVLNTPVPGGVPVVYAPAVLLGLDLVGGPDSDDLDALILTENGIPGYQPSMAPNDWAIAGGGSDMLLFSVRRGSAVIGMPSSNMGIPICEGDILSTPLAPALGGLSPFPSIYMAAENLGLATARSMPATGPFSDDVDALELPIVPLFDCNGNGVEDAFDIAVGGASDLNMNGIPDSCELLTTPFCFCPAPLAPCGNTDASAGCKNSTGVGGLLSASGTTSIASDNLVLSATQLPAFKPGLMFQGATAIAGAPFFDGRRCVGAPIFRHPVTNSGATGSVSYGPGLVAYSIANFAPPGWITLGSTWNFQYWYRDTALPCGNKANVTNAVAATFTP
jgi:hypothetical protein